jgi:hypothetical protein
MFNFAGRLLHYDPGTAVGRAEQALENARRRVTQTYNTRGVVDQGYNRARRLLRRGQRFASRTASDVESFVEDNRFVIATQSDIENYLSDAESLVSEASSVLSRAGTSISSASSRWGTEFSELGSESWESLSLGASSVGSFVSGVEAGTITAEEASAIIAASPALIEFAPVVLVLAAVFGTAYVAYILHQRVNGEGKNGNQKPIPAGVQPPGSGPAFSPGTSAPYTFVNPKLR